MRRLVILFLIGLSLLSSGCALFVDGSRNLAIWFTRPIERHDEWKRNYQWADHALAVECAQNEAAQHKPFSQDFVAGFRDGFAEYLFRGGNGEPPLLPPLRYRRFHYQTPQGYQAIEDWFAGYRHGAAAAKGSGYREWITGPSSLHNGPLGAAPPPAISAVVPEVSPDDRQKPPTQLLPAPRPLPDSAPQKQSATQPSNLPVVLPLSVTPAPLPTVVPLDARPASPPMQPTP